MRLTLAAFCCLALLAALPARAAIIDEAIEVEGNLLKFTIESGDGGAISYLAPVGAAYNLAGPHGILQEGFGSGSLYVPNRRLNETLEVLEEFTDRPVFRYSYDCQGPNINGIRVVRQVEGFPDEATILVTWTITNNGTEQQWIAPWIRSGLAPGGKADPADRLDIPTLRGLTNATNIAYHPAARNWAATTDPTAKDNFFSVFHAEHTHAFFTVRDPAIKDVGIQANFVPRLLAPGASWTTRYRIGAVRGLARVDFASGELAAQLDYTGGKLALLMSATKALPGLTLRPKITTSGGKESTFPAKKFDLTPGRLVRASWDWPAPADGVYTFTARLQQDGRDLPLGKETGSPSGAIDTQFIVGRPARRGMPAWTEAPHLLDHGGRKLDRTMAHTGAAAIWIDSPLFKVFREDTPTPKGPTDPTARLSLAANEHESFQVVIRPPQGRTIQNLRLTPGDLTTNAGALLPASQISWYAVGYVPIRIPTHYEGPTGSYPDPLRPVDSLTVGGGICTPLWVTLHAAPGTPPGLYRGPLQITGEGIDPITLTIEARVYNFELPNTPALKTDFGFDPEEATTRARSFGGTAGPALLDAYAQNAAEHRITLRELAAFPDATSDYAAALSRFKEKLPTLEARGTTTFAVPAELLAQPENLRRVNTFVKENGLEGRAFAQLSDEPDPLAWPKVTADLEKWNTTAPSIPAMVTTLGLTPFIPDAVGRWAIHSQVLDTPAHERILQETAKGREIWWYVNHTPPRPYGNFFLDFAGIEHRVLFWQAFALGIRGMHYWSINYTQPGQDPYEDLSDATPVNGDGFLVYPGPQGPINSIRWEIIRDGIEDYDYLALYLQRRARLRERGGHEALLQKAAQTYNLGEVAPSLVGFPRDPEILTRRRAAIAEMIEEIDRAAP